MAAHRLAGAWNLFKEQAKQHWGQLPEDRFHQLESRRERLAGLIQQRNGVAREEADRRQVVARLSQSGQELSGSRPAGQRADRRRYASPRLHSEYGAAPYRPPPLPGRGQRCCRPSLSSSAALAAKPLSHEPGETAPETAPPIVRPTISAASSGAFHQNVLAVQSAANMSAICARDIRLSFRMSCCRDRSRRTCSAEAVRGVTAWANGNASSASRSAARRPCRTAAPSSRSPSFSPGPFTWPGEKGGVHRAILSPVGA